MKQNNELELGDWVSVCRDGDDSERVVGTFIEKVHSSNRPYCVLFNDGEIENFETVEKVEFNNNEVRH
tara:strand:+ start:82 stop:285 length:204 start_codon:yes stop_codon:yes gene_type:complete